MGVREGGGERGICVEGKKGRKKGLMENHTSKRESERESDSVVTDTGETRATGREAVLLLRREVPQTVAKMGGSRFQTTNTSCMKTDSVKIWWH